MRNGQAFVGFREATINFPPTFKYDVLRTIRHRRRRSRHTHAAVDVIAPQEPVDEGEQPEPEGQHGEGSSEDDTNGELASVISSVTTTYSQPDHTSDEDNDSDAESDYLRRRIYSQHSGGIVRRISMSAAQRAKSKWAELIHAPSSQRFVRSPWTNAQTLQVKSNSGSSSKSPRSVPTTPLLSQRSTSSIDHPPDDVLASVSSLKARVHPSPSINGDGTAEREDDRGVYDSSSKQRVPSWCDRILFKSTVKPDEDDAHAAPQRNAVSLLTQAWRSFRRSSSTSLRSATATSTTFATSSSSNPIPPISPAGPEPGEVAARPPPTAYVPRRKRARPHSIDIAALGAPSSQPPPSLTTARPGTSSGVQMQRPLSAKSSVPPNLPPRPPRAPSAPPTSPDRLHDESLSVVRTPVGNSHNSATTPPVTGGWRGHPRWRLKSFLSRDAEAAREAATSGSSAVAASAANGGTAAGADASSLTGMAMTAAPSSMLLDGEPDGTSTTSVPAPAESARPRKGDVVCLSYRTLDDRGMRRLEGRSDHRPVIGVYAIYV